MSEASRDNSISSSLDRFFSEQLKHHKNKKENHQLWTTIEQELPDEQCVLEDEPAEEEDEENEGHSISGTERFE
jgi:hypothetical protein